MPIFGSDQVVSIYNKGLLELLMEMSYNGWTVSLSENLKFSNDSEKTSTSVPLEKLKQVRLGADYSDLKLKYYATRQGVNSAYAQVKISGVDEGLENEVPTEELVTLDLSGLVAGDTIEVWGRKGTATGIVIKEMRLYYDLTEAPKKYPEPTIEDP